MTNILSAIKFYDELYTIYDKEKEKLIKKWTRETKDNQNNQDKLSSLMKTRDADIVNFIENILRDLNNEPNKQQIKEIISKKIDLLINNDKNKYKIENLMKKYSNLIMYLNNIKINKNPKQELSSNELERRVAEAQAKRERNEETIKIKTQMETNSHMARELDKQNKIETHKHDMKTNENYKKKFDEEIQLLNNKIKEYIKLEQGRKNYKSKIELLNAHIENWYLHTPIEKNNIINNIHKNMI